MNSHILSVKTSTWYKDSHSLYDYESNKITQQTCEFPINEKSIAVFREKNRINSIKLRNQYYDLFQTRNH